MEGNDAVRYGFILSRPLATAALALVAASCSTPQPPEAPETVVAASEPLRPDPANGRIVAPRATQSGAIFREDVHGSPVGSVHNGVASDKAGDITLNFRDTDMHEVVKTILGDQLKVNYSIDSGIQGTISYHTARPLRREELIPTLQMLLSQNGARLLLENGVFRVATNDDATIVPPIVGNSPNSAGSEIIPLHYTSAKQLASIVEPYIGDGGKIIADVGRNSVMITGSSSARETMRSLIRTFDVDFMAGQSYALFPVHAGTPDKVAENLLHAFEVSADGPGTGAIDVVPVNEVNAVLVIARQPVYIDRAAKLVSAFDRAAETTGRAPHVYFLKNVRAVDVQPLLQHAFNKGESGDTSSSLPGSLPPNAQGAQVASSAPAGGSSAGAGGASAGGTSGGLQSNFNQSGQNGSGGTASSGGLGSGSTGTGGQNGATKSALGSLEPTAVDASEGSPKILADEKTNSLLIMATDDEYRLIEATARQLDVLPLQVYVEATIAEVDLNNDLQYGTQFFLKHGALATTLSNATSGTVTTPTSGTTNSQLFQTLLQPSFPGFAATALTKNVQVALEALKTVTNVKVISSPTVLIMDNQSARLQVGDSVPIISASSQSTIAADAPIVNSVNYRDTGVILDVTPRINSGGLITLDLDQEVSEVSSTTSSSINSPTFQERRITSRIIVRDGETVSLAGLIQSKVTKDKSGIPLLSDIPVVGPALFATTTDDNDRTELMVFLTPHIIRDDRDMRTLSDSLREKIGLVRRAFGSAQAPPAEH